MQVTLVKPNTDICLMVRKTSALAIPHNTATEVTSWVTPEVDTYSWFNTTNGRFTPTRPCRLLITGGLCYSSGGANGATYCLGLKNGVQVASGGGFSDTSSSNYLNMSMIVDFNGTTDYISLAGFQLTGISKNLSSDGSGNYICAVEINR